MLDCVAALHEKGIVRVKDRLSMKKNKRVAQEEADVGHLRVEASEGQGPQRLPFIISVVPGA